MKKYHNPHMLTYTATETPTYEQKREIANQAAQDAYYAQNNIAIYQQELEEAQANFEQAQEDYDTLAENRDNLLVDEEAARDARDYALTEKEDLYDQFRKQEADAQVALEYANEKIRVANEANAAHSDAVDEHNRLQNAVNEAKEAVYTAMRSQNYYAAGSESFFTDEQIAELREQFVIARDQFDAIDSDFEALEGARDAAKELAAQATYLANTAYMQLNEAKDSVNEAIANLNALELALQAASQSVYEATEYLNIAINALNAAEEAKHNAQQALYEAEALAEHLQAVADDKEYNAQLIYEFETVALENYYEDVQTWNNAREVRSEAPPTHFTNAPSTTSPQDNPGISPVINAPDGFAVARTHHNGIAGTAGPVYTFTVPEGTPQGTFVIYVRHNANNVARHEIEILAAGEHTMYIYGGGGWISQPVFLAHDTDVPVIPIPVRPDAPILRDTTGEFNFDRDEFDGTPRQILENAAVEEANIREEVGHTVDFDALEIKDHTNDDALLERWTPDSDDEYFQFNPTPEMPNFDLDADGNFPLMPIVPPAPPVLPEADEPSDEDEAEDFVPGAVTPPAAGEATPPATDTSAPDFIMLDDADVPLTAFEVDGTPADESVSDDVSIELAEIAAPLAAFEADSNESGDAGEAYGEYIALTEVAVPLSAMPQTGVADITGVASTGLIVATLAAAVASHYIRKTLKKQRA